MTVGTEHANLDSCFEGQESVSGIAHFEYAAKPVFGQVPDLQNLQVRRDRAEVELIDEDVIDDDGRLGRFVQRRGQELLRSGVEGGVCCQRGPVEVESHFGASLQDLMCCYSVGEEFAEDDVRNSSAVRVGGIRMRFVACSLATR